MSIPVFHSYGKWYLSGVNTWTVNMVRGMQGSEFEQKVLFTGIPRQPQPELDELGVPYTFLDLPAKRSRQAEWRKLKRFLEAHAPCIYIPNFDFHRSCAVGKLSPEVKICGVIHSDEECYYDELDRVGSNFDAIVAVSSTIARKIKERFPHLAERVEHIPHGIPTPAAKPDLRSKAGPIQLAYCNRIQQYQKRVFDLPPILSQLKRLGVDFHLTIAGDGPDAKELRRRFADAEVEDRVTMLGRIPNAQVLNVFRAAHFFFLTSDFEGLPISLIEAMATGCLPVAYQIDSGIGDLFIGELVECAVPHGECLLFAQKVNELLNNPHKYDHLSTLAAATAHTKHSIKGMVSRYEDVFSRCLDNQISRNQKTIRPHEIRLSNRLKKKFQQLYRQSQSSPSSDN